MPIGCVSLVPQIVADISLMRPKPKKILDCGIGFGFWGAAIRQWQDQGVVVQPCRHMEDGVRLRWGTYLMGIEGFYGYKNACWDLYDHIHIIPIEQYLADFKNDRFDVILLLDVLEHFDKDGGVNVLRELKGRLAPGGHLYVGTPGVWCEQGAAYGNELERHRSLWMAEDLEALGFRISSMTILPVDVVHHGLNDEGRKAEGGDRVSVTRRHGAIYAFDGERPDPWGNQMLLARYEAPGVGEA